MSLQDSSIKGEIYNSHGDFSIIIKNSSSKSLSPSKREGGGERFWRMHFISSLVLMRKKIIKEEKRSKISCTSINDEFDQKGWT